MVESIQTLWYVTHKNNLPSILQNGILSKEECARLRIRGIDVSFRSVQRRRTGFHEYVPLFFADNTPMLYVVFQEFQQNIVLLEINAEIMDTPGCLFSDGNIASGESNLYSDVAALEGLDWHIILSRRPAYWREWKRIRSAEVLIPDRVPTEYIQKIHTAPKNVSIEVLLAGLQIIGSVLVVVDDLCESGVR